MIVCEDFRPGNMLVGVGKTVAVFDWEWICARSLDLSMSPPPKLCKDWPAVSGSDQRATDDRNFKKFVIILQDEENQIASQALSQYQN